MKHIKEESSFGRICQSIAKTLSITLITLTFLVAFIASRLPAII